MVDFQSDATVTTPAGELIKVLILQRRNDFLEALEAYNRLDCKGIQADDSVVKARLFTLFLEIQAALRRRYDTEKGKEAYDEIERKVKSKDLDENLEAFTLINEELDTLKLTRIDTQKSYDRTRVERENKEKKL